MQHTGPMRKWYLSRDTTDVDPYPKEVLMSIGTTTRERNVNERMTFVAAP